MQSLGGQKSAYSSRMRSTNKHGQEISCSYKLRTQPHLEERSVGWIL